VREELAYCRRIIRRGYPWPIVEVTGKSIEESAKEVISLVESQRAKASFDENDLRSPWDDFYQFLRE